MDWSSFGRRANRVQQRVVLDARDAVRTREAAQTTPVRGEIAAPAATATPADDDLTARLEEEARRAEARAAELRARAEQSRAADGSR